MGGGGGDATAAAPEPMLYPELSAPESPAEVSEFIESKLKVCR
jgi:hypothetical protein